MNKIEVEWNQLNLNMNLNKKHLIIRVRSQKDYETSVLFSVVLFVALVLCVLAVVVLSCVVVVLCYGCLVLWCIVL